MILTEVKMNNMIYIIYISGFIATWVVCKYVRGKRNNGWEDVRTTLMVSILSWVGLFYLLFFTSPKPPKWL